MIVGILSSSFVPTSMSNFLHKTLVYRLWYYTIKQWIGGKINPDDGFNRFGKSNTSVLSMSVTSTWTAIHVRNASFSVFPLDASVDTSRIRSPGTSRCGIVVLMVGTSTSGWW